MKRSLIAGGVAAAMLAVPAAASAHVTVNPREAAPGSFTVLTIRVPNERDDKGTVKVDLRLPDGFYFLSYKKVRGWRTTLTRETLTSPVDLGGFSVDEQFTRIVWRGNPRRGGIIRPDQFEEFPISVRMPDGNPGDQLAFPAFQTYRGGERVAWTGAPDADAPAPRVTLTAEAQCWAKSRCDRGARAPRVRQDRARGRGHVVEAARDEGGGRARGRGGDRGVRPGRRLASRS